MTSSEEWRDPTPDEIRVILRLLSPDFPGSEAYRAQVTGIKVQDLGDCVFYLDPPIDARPADPPISGPLVDGDYADSDGIRVEMFIVAKNGRLHFLDVMKLHGNKSLQAAFPPDEAIRVTVSPPAQSPPPSGAAVLPLWRALAALLRLLGLGHYVVKARHRRGENSD